MKLFIYTAATSTAGALCSAAFALWDIGLCSPPLWGLPTYILGIIACGVISASAWPTHDRA